MGYAAAIQLGGKFLPYLGLGAGLSIPFLGGQQDYEPSNNIQYGIDYGGNTSTGKSFGIPFPNLNIFNKKDSFTENFLNQGINDSRENPPFLGGMHGQIKGKATEPFLGGEVKPNEFLGGEIKPTEIFSGEVKSNEFPLSSIGMIDKPLFPSVLSYDAAADGYQSNTFNNSAADTTTTSSGNNNNNKKDGNNLTNKLLLATMLFQPAKEIAENLGRKIQKSFDKNDDTDKRTEFEKIYGKSYDKITADNRKREDELMNRQAFFGGIDDYNKYQYLGSKAYTDAAKNIGRNTQDMLRSMAYGQAAFANTIAGASKAGPLQRKYFS